MSFRAERGIPASAMFRWSRYASSMTIQFDVSLSRIDVGVAKLKSLLFTIQTSKMQFATLTIGFQKGLIR